MKLSDAERGMLLSKMSDETIASIFGRRASWVSKARAWLAANPAEPVICGKPEKAPRSVQKAVSPKPPPQVKRAPDPDPKLAPGRLLTVEETIAACPQPLLAGLPRGEQVMPSEVARFLGEPGQTFMGAARGGVVGRAAQPAAATEKPATRPLVAPPAPDPGITPAVLRYAKWFHDAKWTWREISELFEVEAIALRYALTGELPQA